MSEPLAEAAEELWPRPGGAGPIRVRVPAKINVHLAVGPARDDGFHELVTVFHAVSLYDELTAQPSDQLELTVTGDGADELPGVDDNLATRAVRALAEVTGRAPNVRLAIHKGIPIAGGMAGGSADAAAALVACDALWGTGMPRDNLAEIAATLGSDVPFLLSGGTALGTGRGERVSPVLARNKWHWVVAFARQGLSTPAVYGELDRLRAERPDTPTAGDPANLLSALRDADADEFGGLLANDLQPAAISLRPELRRTLHAGREAGALAGIVSGSGPTCAFLARSSSHAIEVAAELAGMGVARTVRTAHGPVPGARLV